jgi:hypothetical protein
MVTKVIVFVAVFIDAIILIVETASNKDVYTHSLLNFLPCDTINGVDNE